MMAELPTNFLLLDRFLDTGIDGVSIGSNDLTQLVLGVDRDNELSASLLHFYEGSRRLLLGSIGETQIEAIDVLRADVIEIRDALKTANSG